MQLNGSTEIYGIMGKPVSHSLSPAMHNAAFDALTLNKVYVAFEVDDVASAMAGFRALGVKGVSVTIPHKQAVIPYLDDIDPVAEKIGAVNTLLINGDSIKGLNTDWLGANRALEEKIGIKDKKVLLLGAGGSARAIGFGLLEASADLKISSRTPEKGRELAASLGCQWHPLSEAAEISADILINATSVGMSPRQDETPFPGGALTKFQVVMDIVYSPLETRLLREATAAGCTVINGLAMLLYQGAAQFELWTGRPAPLNTMRRVLESSLAAKNNQ